MDFESGLAVAANLAAVATAAFAGTAFFQFHLERRWKRQRLEEYLRGQKGKKNFGPEDKGQRTVLHLMANLGMTESEVINAALRSRRISRRVSVDPRGAAAGILFEYSGADPPAIDNSDPDPNPN